MKRDSRSHILAALVILLALILFGAWYFQTEEKWSIVDSFYFTIMTITSVGYGDLVPTHNASKIVTSLYSLVSIPIVVFVLSTVAKGYFEERISGVENKLSELLRHEKNLEEEVREINQGKQLKKRGFWANLFGIR